MSRDRITRTGQIKVYLGKCFRIFSVEKQWKNFVSTALIMAIISMVTGKDMFVSFSDTRNGSFAIICACIWIGLFNSIQSICKERDIIKREYRTGLHISSYILAHVIFEAFLCAVESVIVLLIMCLRNISHLPASGLVGPLLTDMYFTIFLVVFGADMIAILISSIVRNENTAMTVMPFVLIIQLVMSGTVFHLEGLTEMISYFTLSKWGLDGICAIANTTRSVNNGYLFSGLESCDPKASTLLMVWMILLAYALIYILLSVIVLKRVDKDTR